MNTSDDDHREAVAKYSAMESGATAAAVVLLLAALVAAWLYRPSVWFALGCAAGGALVFLGWRATITGNASLSGPYSLAGIAVLVGTLTVEIDRPLHVLFACGFSIIGAVLFGLVSATRQTRR